MNKRNRLALKWTIYVTLVTVTLIFMLSIGIEYYIKNILGGKNSPNLYYLLTGATVVNLLAIFFNPAVEVMRSEMFSDDHQNPIKTYFANFFSQIIMSIIFGIFIGIMAGFLAGSVFTIFLIFPENNTFFWENIKIALPFALIVSTILVAFGRCLMAFLGPLISFCVAAAIGTFIGGPLVGLLSGIVGSGSIFSFQFQS